MSARKIKFRMATSVRPSTNHCWNCSNETFTLPVPLSDSCRDWVSREAAISRALLISGSTKKGSPAAGGLSSPAMLTGVEGPAASTRTFGRNVSYKALTCPYESPQSTMSPTRSVPFVTIALAITPRPPSCSASRHVPIASRGGLAWYSCKSAIVNMVSTRSSIPSPEMALV